MKKLLSLTIIMTAFVVLGCNDNEIDLKSISVWPQTLIIHPGENAILDVNLHYGNGSTIHYEDANPNVIKWKSNNPGVVEVIDGIVYGIKFGMALITPAPEGCSSNQEIRVYVVENEDTQHFGPAMLDLTDVTTTTASFRTYIDIDEDDEYAFVYCKGHFYSPDEILEAEDAAKIIINKETNIELTNLWPGSSYSYVIHCNRSAGFKYFCNGNFITDFPEGSIFDLSAKGTANCYIVPKKGTYRFEVNKGNSSRKPNTTTVKVLWETLGSHEGLASGDLIEDVSQNLSWIDGANVSHILFKTNDTFKEGNALIAAYNNEGEITWSWHIWFTEQEPREIPYKNDSGIMMDRNLGALSSTPDFRANGLLYQWGRKDPFIGSSSVYESVPAKSTNTWPIPVISDYSRGTIEYSIAHPTTFIRSNNNGDWDYKLTSDRWTTSDKKKSMYDPCPVGWRVPDGGESGIWAKASGKTNDFSSGTDFSSVFGTNGESIYYPPAGIYDHEDGELVYGGRYFTCWSATQNNDASDDSSYAFLYSTYSSYGNYAYPTIAKERAIGASVRCAKE